MNSCENKNTKTGNQSKKCADIKSLTAYRSGGEGGLLATDFSFTHIGSEKEKVKNCYRKCNSKESMVLQERDDLEGGGSNPK